MGSEENKFIFDVDILIKDVIVISDKRFIWVYENILVDVVVKEGFWIRYVWDFSDGSRYSVYFNLVK